MEESPQSRGGKIRAQRLSEVERIEIARKAANKRWSAPKATHEGVLEIPGIVPLRVANLDDGRRVLISRAFLDPTLSTRRTSMNL
jgi:hypothetical protein